MTAINWSEVLPSRLLLTVYFSQFYIHRKYPRYAIANSANYNLGDAMIRIVIPSLRPKMLYDLNLSNHFMRFTNLISCISLSLLLIFISLPASANWNANGLWSDAKSVATDPGDSKIIYVGTATGGMLKSSDGGINWLNINSGLTCATVSSIIIDSKNSQIIYAVTNDALGNYKIYKSDNAGNYWSVLANTGLSSTTPINSLTIDPNNSLTLYIGSNAGVLKSIDGGLSWSTTNIGMTNSTCYTVVVDPNDSQVLYAGTGGGVFKSTSGGSPWKSSGLASATIKSLAIDPSNSQKIIAGKSGIGGIQRSTDGGATWTQQLSAMNGDWTKIVYYPNNSQIIYASSTYYGFYVSTDAGVKWTSLNIGLPISTSINSFAIEGNNAQNIIAATRGEALDGPGKGGIFKSTNGGTNWIAIYGELTKSNGIVNTVVIDPSNSQTLYSGTDYDGIFKSIDGGISWNPYSTDLPARYTYPGYYSIKSFTIDPLNTQTLYALTAASYGLYTSFDGGGTWYSANTGLPSTLYSFAIDPVNSSTLYAGTLSGVYKSTSSGNAWTASNTGFTSNAYALLIDNTNTQTIYIGTGTGVYKSTNAGSSWSAANIGMSYYKTVSLAIDPQNNQIVYAGTESNGLYKSLDGGIEWSAISTGLPSKITFITIDPTNTSTIYAGSPASGIYKSTNGGTSWTALVTNNGLVNPAVNALAIDKNNNQIIYAGASGGVFKSITGGAPSYIVSVATVAHGNILPSTTKMVSAGSTTTFTITSENGYSVVSPIGGTCPQGIYHPELTTNNYTTGSIVGDCTVAPTFVANEMNLTVTSSGTGSGTVTSNSTRSGIPNDITCGAGPCIATYPYGSTVSISALAGSTSIFDGWSGDCAASPCNIHMNGDKSVNAVFSLAPYAKNISIDTIYTSLDAAVLNALQGNTILALDTQHSTTISLDKGITLTGGFSPSYLSQSGGYSELIGDLTVVSGDSSIETFVVHGKVLIQSGVLRVKYVKVY